MTETADITICVGTYGDEEKWSPLLERAKESAQKQSLPPKEVLTCHGPTLATARNACGESAAGEWLLFLDADDTLDYWYVEAIWEAAWLGKETGFNYLFQPSTLGVYPDGKEDDHPVMIERCDLSVANHLVIGTTCKRDAFLSVGGFRELPMLEDWDCWQRLVIAGGVVIQVPGAIYRVLVNQDGRNSDQGLHGRVYSEIRKYNAQGWKTWKAHRT